MIDAAATDRDSLPEVYERLWPGMVRLATLLVGSHALAEDVVQDAFMASAPRLEAVANPGAYLRAAVVNRARGVHRRAALDTRLPRAPAAVTGEPELDETWHLVQALPYRQRTALVLRFYEDLSELQIAEVLGCRPGTVKSTIHRALARLRQEMS